MFKSSVYELIERDRVGPSVNRRVDDTANDGTYSDDVETGRLDRWKQFMVESPWLLAVVLCAGAIVEVLVPSDVDHRTAALIAAPLITLPLAWRRTRTVIVALVVCSAMAAQSVLGVDTNAELTAFVAILVSTYSAGRWTSLRRGVIAPIAAIVVPCVLVVTSNEAFADSVFVGFFVLSSYLLGRAVQLRTLEARRQAIRATLAEAMSEERAREAIEAERQRIARELHDLVAHAVSLMVVQAGAAAAVLGSDPARAGEPLATIQRLGRDALVDMHHLLGLLRTSDDAGDLDPDPTLEALPRLVAELNDAGLTVSLDVDGDPVGCPTSVGVSGYRVVREALTNVLRHAGSVAVDVRVDIGQSQLDVDVHDAGTGPFEQGSAGFGLIGMQERVAVFGGRFDAGPDPSGGYRVHAAIPYDTALAGRP